MFLRRLILRKIGQGSSGEIPKRIGTPKSVTTDLFNGKPQATVLHPPTKQAQRNSGTPSPTKKRCHATHSFNGKPKATALHPPTKQAQSPTACR